MNTQITRKSQALSFTAALVAILAVMGGYAHGQQSSAVLDLPVVVAPQSTDFRALVDLDGDGRKEAVSINFPSASAITVAGWQFGNAAPSVGWQVTYNTIAPGTPLTTSIVAGDFNGDGREDFALSVANYIGWWLSNGSNAVPTVEWVLVRPSAIVSMMAADFNGDGRSELVALNSTDIEVFECPSGSIPVLRSSAVAPPQLGSGSIKLLNVNANADATPDVGVMFVNYSLNPTGAQCWLFAMAGMTIGAHSTVGPIVGGHALPVAVAGDIDNDGDEDIVVFTINRRVIVRRTGPSNYNIESEVPAGPASTMADVDGDGRLDAVGYMSDLGQPNWVTGATASKFFVHLNDGTGGFLAPQEIPALGWSSLAGVADLDGDGDVDLVGGRCVRWTTQARRAPVALPVIQPVYPWTPADIDGDGDPDYAAQVSAGLPAASTTLTLVRNEGDGSLATVTSPLVVSSLPAGWVLVGPGVPGDFNGDGTLDLLVLAGSTTQANAFSSRLLLNLGGGGFVDGGPASAMGRSPFEALPGPGSPTGVWVHPVSMLVVDVDGDGDLDLIPRAFADSLGVGGANSRVWINSGTGYFTPGQAISGALALEVADFDGDQIRDMLVVSAWTNSSSYGTLGVCHGLGNGSFASPMTIDNAFDTRYRVSVADVDQDGDLDIAVADSNGVGVLLNSGTGTFTAAYVAAALTTSSTSSMALPPETTNQAFFVDMNNDGLLDLVGGPLASAPTCSVVCLAIAPGVFAPPIQQGFVAKAIADVDGDGDPDIITRDRVYFGGQHRYPEGGVRLEHGGGLPGSSGFEPVLGDVGPFRAGVNGSVRITNGLGGALGYMAMGFAETSLPIAGGVLQVTPDILVPIQLGGTVGIPGAGSLVLPWTMPPGLAGMVLHHQAAFIDSAAPQGISFTRVLSVTIGS